MQNAERQTSPVKHPPSKERLLAQLSPESYVKHLRRNYSRKLKSGNKLSAVELHLAKNICALERACFAPSVGSVMLRTAKALVRPLLALFILFVGAIYAARSFPDQTYLTRLAIFGDSVLVATGIDLAENEDNSKVDFVQLALVLAADNEADDQQTPQESEQNSDFAAIDVPKLPDSVAELEAGEDDTTIQAAPVDIETLKAETPAEIVASAYQPSSLSDAERYSDMRHRRNLVKFISGLISAFRPTVTDSSAIAKHIVELAARENIDPLYIAAVIAIESRFAPQAQSHVGALGLMQLMPGTAKMLAKSANAPGHSYRHLVDPRTNIKLGISFLKQLETRYRGNRYLALSAYNWGPAHIDRGRRIPRSVQKYARTVLDRTHTWRRHFDKAIKQADALALNFQQEKTS